MVKQFRIVAAAFGLVAGPLFAAEQPVGSSKPVALSDAELDQVVAGDPIIAINVGVFAPIDVHVEPITVSVPVNVAAIVQANVLGNGVFDAVAVGTQNVFQAAGVLKPGG